MPRVSRPAAPASARKHGVQAVTRIGSASSSSTDLAHQIGERHFGGRNQPAAVGGVELILREFRQLRGAEHGLIAHDQQAD